MLLLLQVSIVSFRLVSVAAVLQMQNDDMAVAVTCDHVIPCEYGNIDLDKFQMKFSAGQSPHSFAVE